MTSSDTSTSALPPLAPIDRLARSRPDLVLALPLLVYVLLLSLPGFVSPDWQPLVIVLRGVISLWVVWRFRRYLPPWGKPHWVIAIISGAVIAWGWAAGQAWLDSVGVPERLPLFPGVKEVVDPRAEIGAKSLFRATWLARMSVAVLAVPVVEELFWRAFLLRALISWHDFEKVPLGTFTWQSFLGTSLISTIQHPDNWVVSVFCWMAFNALFYWTRSILCLVLIHGITNLVLYLIVLRISDWSHW
jgi:membrane protease YdiL (CAAX protease family)